MYTHSRTSTLGFGIALVQGLYSPDIPLFTLDLSAIADGTVLHLYPGGDDSFQDDNAVPGFYF